MNTSQIHPPPVIFQHTITLANAFAIEMARSDEMNLVPLTDEQIENWANMYTLTLSIPPDRRFRMSTWGVPEPNNECGTAACMAGHAALHPFFRGRGLGMGVSMNKLENGWVDGTIMPKNIEHVFGYEARPFSPTWILHELEMLYDEHGDPVNTDVVWISPEDAAEAVKRWIVIHHRVPEEVWIAAVAGATATYDPKHVHQYTPWNEEFDIEAFWNGEAGRQSDLRINGYRHPNPHYE